MTTIIQKIQIRRGTEAQWAAANPILDDGEPGYATDAKRWKLGDGVTPWSEALYEPDFEHPRPMTSTGVLHGGVMTVNADPTLINISAAHVMFVDDHPNAEDPRITTILTSAFVGVPIPGIATSLTSFVGIDNTGSPVVQVTPFTPTQRRHIATLGVVVHSNLTSINGVNSQTSYMGQEGAQLYDLMEAIGPIAREGMVYSPVGANLQIQRSAGVMFKAGANAPNSLDDPHNLSIPASTVPATFRYRTRSGAEGADVTAINPGLYDNAGALTAVGGTQFTVQRVFLFQSGITRVQYGQAVYANMDDAVAAIGGSTFVAEPNARANGALRALIIVRGNATDLTNATTSRIVTADRLGGMQ